jgi:multicomponent Na+:H+ antiporter subunit B
MTGPHGSVVVRTTVRLLIPFAQLFALYVLVHGHESPGGGFQAGVIVAATAIVAALAFGREALERRVSESTCLALATGGVLLYLGIGVAPMPLQATFLDYGALPLPGGPPSTRYFGILLVEIAIMLSVAATLILLFFRLADR